MKDYALKIALLMFACSASLLAQEQSSQYFVKLRVELAERVAGSNVEAGTPEPSTIVAIRSELAAAGDEEQILYFVGALGSTNDVVFVEAFEWALYIDDPRIICAVASNLDKPDKPLYMLGKRGPNGEESSGVILPSRPSMAAEALAKLLKDPPIAPKRSYTSSELRKWNRWWKNNRHVFEKGAEKLGRDE